MLAPDTFSVRWLRAVTERHHRSRVLFWYPLWAVLGLFAVAILFDVPMLEALREWPAGERAFFRWFTDFGKSDWMLIPTLVAGLLSLIALKTLPLAYSWRWALRGVGAISAYVFATIAISGIVVVILKRLIGRARPMYLDELGPLYFRPFDILDWSFHSFPSGHATTALAFAVVIGTLANRRFYGWIIALGLVIGLSRIVVGDHYLSDVIAGSVVGFVSAIVIRDWFVTRNWGMRMENGQVHYRMLSAFQPLWRKLARRQIPALTK